MTLDAVRTARDALVDAGITPTLNAIVQEIGGSKRDIQRHMKALAEEPVPVAAPTPDRAGIWGRAPADEPDPLGDATAPDPALPPLVAAMEARDRAQVRAYAAAQEHTAAKARRDQLKAQLQATKARLPLLRTPAEIRAARAQQEALTAELATVEAARLEAQTTSEKASDAERRTGAAYRHLVDEARRWLHALRHAARLSAGGTPHDQIEAEELGQQTLDQLAALVGEDEAQRLADDPLHRPQWAREI